MFKFRVKLFSYKLMMSENFTQYYDVSTMSECAIVKHERVQKTLLYSRLAHLSKVWVAAVGEELVCEREPVTLVSGRSSHRSFTTGQNKSLVREYKQTKKPWDLEGHSLA